MENPSESTASEASWGTFLTNTQQEAADDQASHARLLRQRFVELQHLMSTRSNEVDPTVLGQMEALKEQLESLEKRASALAPRPISRAAACTSLAIEAAGGVRAPSVVNAFKALTEQHIPVAEAAGLSIFRLIASCFNDITDEHLLEFKNKTLFQLPAIYVEKAESSEGEAQVLELYAETWEELKDTYAQIRQGGKVASTWGGNKPPVQFYFMLAVVPTMHLLRYLYGRYFRGVASEEQALASESKQSGKKTSKAADAKVASPQDSGSLIADFVMKQCLQNSDAKVAKKKHK